MSQTVFLFDIDGVLVEPGGYRKATQATLNWFTRRMGLPDQVLGEETFALFESKGITSEWDILPLCLAGMLDDLLGRCPGLALPEELEAAGQALRAYGPPAPQVDYAALVRRVTAGGPPRGYYAEHALRLSREGTGEAPFPRLAGRPLLERLLAGTHAVETSAVTRIFQQYVMGSEIYRRQLGLTPEVETDSYLRLYDRPALSPALGSRLLELWEAGRLHLAAYTLRPSQPRIERGMLTRPRTERGPGEGHPGQGMLTRPRRIRGLPMRPRTHLSRLGTLTRVITRSRKACRTGRAVARPHERALFNNLSYSPEADLALESLGLEAIPLVGYGQVAQLAETTGGSPAGYAKPSPVQALGALGAALTRDERRAMRAAERWVSRGDPGFFAGLPRLEIHVFEDSAGGMCAVRMVTEMLEEIGIAARLHPWGVTTSPTKRAALAEAGAVCYEDVNEAVGEALDCQSPASGLQSTP